MQTKIKSEPGPTKIQMNRPIPRLQERPWHHLGKKRHAASLEVIRTFLSKVFACEEDGIQIGCELNYNWDFKALEEICKLVKCPLEFL
ncbi:hypothetical protein AVEN_121755-1 [Araneus ventricosus]|uniref:Uncharacterized protein n=1 Tax=Araneus ventricosus TaxID=182803 RepID=A0A4Y2Q800_ARAVE|nr:hypothetical protein AVEN_45276-1 [Araneus ventricosus]GBN58758.1 hypothetical protein AVEN_121755-1 [Araneus ventricosus]